ncbi:MAG: hypothetical protein OEX19_04850 [Gammaproteobacteria bacterium]|nr:hypothetical protein [Gammaproteobacteria bacterium]
MSNEQLIERISDIQKKQIKYKTIIGSAIGVIFLIYFFTFAMFVDKFPPLFFLIELITTPILFALFFFLDRISFAIIKGGFEKQDTYREVIAKMTQNDIDVKPEKIAQR